MEPFCACNACQYLADIYSIINAWVYDSIVRPSASIANRIT